MTTRHQARSFNRAITQPSRRPRAVMQAASLLTASVDGRGACPADYSERWQKIWDAGLAKGEGWDKAAPSPALLDLLNVKGTLGALASKRVLVPGCGRGYDLVAFAAAGAALAVGLEISATAVSEARAYLDSQPEASNASVRMAQGNFLTWEPAAEGGAFDVGYDYTFGCTMHPSDRSKWAASWHRLLAPGATLVTLIFPVDPSKDQHMGPPFPVSPDLYKEHLLAAGFECTSVHAVPDELSHAGRGGKEHLGIWRRV